MSQQSCLLLLLLILVKSNAADAIWILKQTQSMPTDLLQFHAIANNSLLIQTADSIYVAPNNNPSFVQQAFITQFNQRTPVAYDQQSSTYLYINFQYLQYGKTSSSQRRTLQKYLHSVNIIKIKDAIYYIEPTVSSNLTMYNLTSRKTTIGPYLMDAAPNQYGNSIITNPQQTQLRIAIDDKLFLVSLETLKVQQTFSYRQSSFISLMDVASPDFFVQSTESFNNIYKYDQATNQYAFVYTTSINENQNIRFGYVCNDQSSTCKEVQFFPHTSGIYVKITEMDCSQSYDQQVAKLPESNTDLHIVGDDKTSVYSLNQSLGQIRLIKHEIRNNTFVHIYNKSLLIELDFLGCKIYRMWKEKLLVFQDTRFTIVDLETSAQVCKKQIFEYEGLKKDIGQIFFNQAGKEIFIQTKYNLQVMIWINVNTCEIKDKHFDFSLFSIIFWDGKMFAVSSDSPSLFCEIDPTTKEIVSKRTVPVTNSVIFKGSLYGFIPGAYIYTLVKINTQMQIVESKELSCRSLNRYIKVGKDHLSALCNNQYTVFNEDLGYLGSTVVKHLQLENEYIEETASPLLRFDIYHGELHLNSLKKWNHSYSKQSSSPAMCSNLHFYNQTDAIYISKGNDQYFINYATIQLLKFRLVFGMGTGIFTNDAYMNIPFFRWSADKSKILIRYLSRLDNFQVYQNAYDFPSLKLIYSCRAGNAQVAASSTAFIDRNHTLFVSDNKGLEIIDLSKRRTVGLFNFKTGSVFFSSDGEKIFTFGQNQRKQQSIGVVSKGKGEVIYKYAVTTYNFSSKVYGIDQELYVLSGNSLYQHSDMKSTLIQENIADCTYLNKDSIVCLRDNELLIINKTHSTPRLIAGSFSKIKSNPQILLVYGVHSFAIFSAESPFNLIQTINLNQRSADLAMISPDSKVITYDRQNKSFSFWSKSQCPSLTQLNEGICECIQVQVGGVCKCRKGHFESQGKCLECSFYCSECSGGAGGCQALSAGGVLMIVGLALLPVLAGVGVCCYLRRRRAKVSKAQAMSQLLEQRSSSINDD